jgi:hypothetical protein
MFNKTVQGATLVLLFCVYLAHAFAQDPSPSIERTPLTAEKRALISQLLEITELKKTARDFYVAMMDQQDKLGPELAQQALANNQEFQELDPEQQEALRTRILNTSERTSKRARELFDQRVDFFKMVEDVSVELYDKYFTEAELRDLVAFYGTSTGKKMVAVTPKLLAESVSLTIEKIKPQMSDIVRILADEEAQRVDRELEAVAPKPAVTPKPKRRNRTNRP